jgi:hypothetical protein
MTPLANLLRLNQLALTPPSKMPAKPKKKRGMFENVAPDRAQAVAREASKTRAGRDGLTRVQNNRPIRGTETQARQWNRYSP